MDKKELVLSELTPELEYAFWEFYQVLKSDGDAERWLVGCEDLNYPQIMERLKYWKTGQNLPANWVPSSSFFLLCDGRMLGRSSFRHQLNEFLTNIGGHIGYYIRPEERQKGYGTEILRLTLIRAKELGLDRVLVTCDESNIASRKIIKRNGGTLENIYFENGIKEPKRRYWIQL